ncbi:hypothetical protein BO86DRAFT_428221 [Aspergillus japonicus CBS 114.51]|uniref:Uncharacterized protein n=1 Tax=Aspergillus japonicus CBS 114.51 TaxID=1448312 RepID=A0A8T8X4Q0_ASPJA|nr:hypothetical protein BO86DRAFT_428221 [Aspergillus japonicus CBS 114.51]RAH82499.1 hypothetical protein BO86DRAFT_428221 [Aspergillus japonicus CBS 114.51]
MDHYLLGRTTEQALEKEGVRRRGEVQTNPYQVTNRNKRLLRAPGKQSQRGFAFRNVGLGKGGPCERESKSEDPAVIQLEPSLLSGLSLRTRNESNQASSNTTQKVKKREEEEEEEKKKKKKRRRKEGQR